MNLLQDENKKGYEDITLGEIQRNENIKRQFNVLVPFGVAFGETHRKEFLEEANEKKSQELEKQEKQLDLIYKANNRYQLKNKHVIFGDLLCGISSMLSSRDKKDFAGWKFNIYEDPGTGSPKPYLNMILTQKGMRKLAMGATVDGNGNPVHGFSGALESVTDLINRICKNQVTTPMIFATSQKDPVSGKRSYLQKRPIKIDYAWRDEEDVFAHPNRFHGRSEPVGAVVLNIDYDYLPLDLSNDLKIIKGCQFFIRPAGLASILEIGRHCFAKEFNFRHLPSAAALHRQCDYMNLALEYYKQGRRNVITHKDENTAYLNCTALTTVKELYPACLDKTRRAGFDYQLFIDFCDTANAVLFKGLQALHITDKLDKRILFPALTSSSNVDNDIIHFKLNILRNIENCQFNYEAIRRINNYNEKHSTYSKNTSNFTRENPQVF